MGKETEFELIEKAYKKLKSSVYFDKTQLSLRNQIVEFEGNKYDFEDALNELAESLEDEKTWNRLEQKILNSIKILTFPKNENRRKEIEPEKTEIVMNYSPKNTKIEEVQYFIEMDVQGHILGVLWLLLIGYQLDSNIYQHSYGNRIRKSLINDKSEKSTYSPYLFEPYFQQYESWRDTALTHAQNCLTQDQDVIIIAMDLKRYYYSVDVTESSFKELFETLPEETKPDKAASKIHDFVFKVISTYSEKLKSICGQRRILPIGFLPSNVLSNWCLNKFDLAVVNGWNPMYYGRYVDDILIVDKIEKNSDIGKKAEENNLKFLEITDFFLNKCSRWSGLPGEGIKHSLFLKTKKKKDAEYRLNPMYTIDENGKSEIIIQNEKVKLFYFKAGESDALLTCFKNDINKNKSEFRYMPEDVAIFPTDDYSNIFQLNKKDTINKLRGVEGISINKFELSKFLGKNLRIHGLVEDNLESKFETEVTKIFNSRILIENYTSWEKVIELFIVNDHFDSLSKFVSKILESINNIEIDSSKEDTSSNISIKMSLLKVLYSALVRSLALNWNPEDIKKLCHKLKKSLELLDDGSLLFEYDNMDALRQNYYVTRMVNKYAMPLHIDCFLNDKSNLQLNFNLTHFSKSVSNITNVDDKAELDWPEYKYYPYLVTMYDISLFVTVNQLIRISKNKNLNGQNENANNSSNYLNEQIITKQRNKYIRINYGQIDEKEFNTLVQIEQIKNSENWRIKVGNEEKDTISCAVANVKLSDSNFNNVLKDSPNRKYNRYEELAKLINLSIKENADMLIMPEAFIPFEWLPMIARICEKNQFAIVAGVEHIKIGKKVFNLTVTILPYMEGEHKYAQMMFHLKKHYSPEEIRFIEGYRLEPVFGNGYDLFNWRDCWFPVYCCYELASIKDRALFQSYADMIIAVEWNKDVNYYSNILESLSRDLHCYCVQVNSSNYGDSRITQPSKTESKDIIRTKGGKNNTLLVDDLDIKILREFQLKQFELQKDDMEKHNHFKPTPPEFNRKITELKMKKKLWELFEEVNN